MESYFWHRSTFVVTSLPQQTNRGEVHTLEFTRDQVHSNCMISTYTIIRCSRGDIYCVVCVPFCLVASQMVVWIMGEKRNLEAE